jgi:hypothetical protein
MIIHVEQSGGLTGINRRIEIDTEKIPKRDAIKIRKMIESYEVDKQRNESRNESSKKPLKGAADYYNYEITIREGTKNQVIRCDEFSVHENLKKLLKYVQKVKKSAR